MFLIIFKGGLVFLWMAMFFYVAFSEVYFDKRISKQFFAVWIIVSFILSGTFLFDFFNKTVTQQIQKEYIKSKGSKTMKSKHYDRQR